MRYGRLPAQFPGSVKDLTTYVAGPLPAPPSEATVPHVAWGMLGNDRYGDCGVAGLEHAFEADAAIANESESEPDDQQAIDYYLAYTDGQDTGVVLSQYLAHVRAHGYYGHTVDSFAPVTVSDVPTLQSVVSLFGFAYTGITVTSSMEEAFGQGVPWTTSLAQGAVAGGHCVPIVGFDDSFLYAVTWGGVQPISYPAWHLIADEAWAVLTGEFVQAGGDGHVNLAALRADIDRMAA